MPSTAKLLPHVTALVGRVGLVRAARVLGVGREALARLLAGQPVRAGTLALVEQNLPDPPSEQPAA